MALRLLPAAAAGAISIFLALSCASAQESGSKAARPSQADAARQSNEEVTVTAPRAYLQKGDHGGEIRTVAMTGKVKFDDLDLSTPWGRTELKSRIRVMASNLCGALEREYPVAVPGGPSCYEQAVGKAMHVADEMMADTQYDYWKR